jgi:hypothetical protein
VNESAEIFQARVVPLAWDTNARKVINAHGEFVIGSKLTSKPWKSGLVFFSPKELKIW